MSGLERARELLASAELTERCQGVELLDGEPDAESEGELVRLLSDPSWLLRERVVEALQRREPVPTGVLRTLERGPWFARASACDVLRERGEATALAGLVRAVEDRNVSLQKSAVRALGRLSERLGLAAVAEAIAGLPGERRRRVIARVGHQAPEWGIALDGALDDVPAERWSAESGLRKPVPLAATNRGVEASALTRFRRWLSAQSQEAR